jgi:hypothetical protein
MAAHAFCKIHAYGRQIVTHENLIFDADIKENLPLATGGLITTSNSPNLSTWPHLQN